MKFHTAKNPPAHVIYGTVASPGGRLLIGLSGEGFVCRINFMRGRPVAELLAQWKDEWPKTSFASGARLTDWQKKPVLAIGTPFQQEVWKVMAKIPAGSVTTYGEIARYIGRPGAARAVGTACGANPVAYLLPCHRVVAAKGGLGGFSGGLDVKKKLLKAEGYLKK